MEQTRYHSEVDSKATARIERDLYERVRQHFHYGLQTMLFQNIFESIDEKIQSGNFNEVIDYIYKKGSLTLTPIVKE